MRWVTLVALSGTLVALALALIGGFRLDTMKVTHNMGWVLPTCGLTRGSTAIARGDLPLAWHYNPASFLVMGFAVGGVMLTGKVPSFGPPKTRSSYRTVPLPSEVLTVLTEHQRLNPSVEVPALGRLLFTDEKRDPILRAVLARSLRPAAQKAGLPPRTGLHVLRHFYASALIRHGESVKVVQERLGHASASETLDTYSHLWPDSEDRTRAAVAEALSGLSNGIGPPSRRPHRRDAQGT